MSIKFGEKGGEGGGWHVAGTGLSDETNFALCVGEGNRDIAASPWKHSFTKAGVNI